MTQKLMFFNTMHGGDFETAPKPGIFAVRVDRIISMQSFVDTNYGVPDTTRTDGTLIVYDTGGNETGSQFVLGEPQANADAWLNAVLDL